MPERRGSWSLLHRRIGNSVEPEQIFSEIFGSESHAFWLDSSLVEPGLSRFSFLGDCSGPDGEVLSYQVTTGAVEVLSQSVSTTLIAGSVFEVLQRRLAERGIEQPADLPFDFNCGYVGYLGYEMKADCGSPNRHASSLPDAVWMLATRMVVVDHLKQETWLLALRGPELRSHHVADEWIRRTESQLLRAGSLVRPADENPNGTGELDVEPWLVRSRSRYLADIAVCQEKLRAGESYEVCLTNTFELEFNGDPLELYRRQRRVNPAPYAAYLRLPDASVLCSSPERFLKITADRIVESKPIKGTTRRHADDALDERARAELATSAKNKAENLMIVDLLRNDLGRVCEIGTVSVPSLMAIESYATLHQLVSTVRGRLRRGLDAIDAVRACFPGGSMTGAPKLRTMEIIDSLETCARGIYSGAIGFFALGGSADLNIVIRTMVIEGRRLRVGAGGAIVLDSDPEEEFDEMILKARAPLRALAGCAALAQPIDA